MNKEDIYTSTGKKFWLHPLQMYNYQTGNPRTVISTHISPEGRCNLKCEYCSVTHRNHHERIELSTIQKYISILKKAGLRAVIITGGGEPTLYPQINQLLEWLQVQGLKIALITNGTNSDKISDWNVFEWVRVSINYFENWEEKISIPNIRGTLGFSVVYVDQDIEWFKRVLSLCEKLGGDYIRVLPDCLKKGKIFKRKHDEIDSILNQIGSDKFFHQHKYHRKPKSYICHQSFFRPYLSEINGGTVFPCDSVVLNNSNAYFDMSYSICRAEKIAEYLNGDILPNFIPNQDCTECVFTNTVEMLDDWKNLQLDRKLDGINHEGLNHVEFV